MVKVGDKIRILIDGADYASVMRGDEFVVSEVFGEEAIEVAGENNWIFSSCSYEVIHTTPPKKITKNGYEYSLVGPVKPDWLVDGVWVVRKDNGEMHQINKQSENMFSATSSLSRVTGLTAKRVSEEFRPHEPSDWKWGDWALYDGKRVFVMSSLTHDNLVGVSFPNIDGKDLTDPSEQWDFAEVSELTPTF